MPETRLSFSLASYDELVVVIQCKASLLVLLFLSEELQQPSVESDLLGPFICRYTREVVGRSIPAFVLHSISEDRVSKSDTE